MPKQYLRLGEPIPGVGVVIGPAVGHIRGSAQWVTDIRDATADYESDAKVNQERLKNEYGLETTLEEVPGAPLLSKWIICKED
jgi:hypothetical protein